MCHFSMFTKKQNREERKNKPYHAPKIPSEKIQINIKFVPSECLVEKLKGKKLYQYTAIKEATRLRYLSFY